jgi:hypothetical protein
VFRLLTHYEGKSIQKVKNKCREKSDKDNDCDKAALVFHSTTHQAVTFFSKRRKKSFASKRK